MEMERKFSPQRNDNINFCIIMLWSINKYFLSTDYMLNTILVRDHQCLVGHNVISHRAYIIKKDI